MVVVVVVVVVLVVSLNTSSPVIELVGGSGPHAGNVMIRGQPVCDDHWTRENAGVVCRFDQGLPCSSLMYNQ